MPERACRFESGRVHKEQLQLFPVGLGVRLPAGCNKPTVMEGSHSGLSRYPAKVVWPYGQHGFESHAFLVVVSGESFPIRRSPDRVKANRI